MDSRRLTYLRALDVDVWERRDRPAADVAAPVARASAAGSLQAPAPTLSLPADAHSDAISALGWDALVERVRSCTACALHATRTQGVFGIGNRAARWMIIGEAPGADEDRQGEPFVGRAGQLLNAMLRAIGLARDEVFIANILKSRPPGNRDPRPEEVRACIPYLYRQIELVNPVLLLCVGRIAAQTLLAVDTPIGQLRGKLHHLTSGRPMVVTYHPAYLLRSPGEKRKAWSDLLLAMRTFRQLSHDAGMAQSQPS